MSCERLKEIRFFLPAITDEQKKRCPDLIPHKKSGGPSWNVVNTIISVFHSTRNAPTLSTCEETPPSEKKGSSAPLDTSCSVRFNTPGATDGPVPFIYTTQEGTLAYFSAVTPKYVFAELPAMTQEAIKKKKPVPGELITLPEEECDRMASSGPFKDKKIFPSIHTAQLRFSKTIAKNKLVLNANNTFNDPIVKMNFFSAFDSKCQDQDAMNMLLSIKNVIYPRLQKKMSNGRSDKKEDWVSFGEMQFTIDDNDSIRALVYSTLLNDPYFTSNKLTTKQKNNILMLVGGAEFHSLALMSSYCSIKNNEFMNNSTITQILSKLHEDITPNWPAFSKDKIYNSTEALQLLQAAIQST
ncbi:MAG: hypothetical protein HQK50_17045 [Oligoflexia bacterium]|nr:hypothetical protein [Oligoflexia bacterium]